MPRIKTKEDAITCLLSIQQHMAEVRDAKILPAWEDDEMYKFMKIIILSLQRMEHEGSELKTY